MDGGDPETDEPCDFDFDLFLDVELLLIARPILEDRSFGIGGGWVQSDGDVLVGAFGSEASTNLASLVSVRESAMEERGRPVIRCSCVVEWCELHFNHFI